MVPTENGCRREHFAGSQTLAIHGSVFAENSIVLFSPLTVVTTFSGNHHISYTIVPERGYPAPPEGLVWRRTSGKYLTESSSPVKIQIPKGKVSKKYLSRRKNTSKIQFLESKLSQGILWSGIDLLRHISRSANQAKVSQKMKKPS
jgi:hypothetical protein